MKKMKKIIKKIILMGVLSLLSTTVFAGEDSNKVLDSVYFQFCPNTCEPKDGANSIGFIYDGHSINGELVIKKTDDSSIKIPIKMTVHGIGLTAFVSVGEFPNKIGIKGLSNNPVSDIFDGSFWGLDLGAALNMGIGETIAVSSNGLFLHDVSLKGPMIGFDLSAVKIAFFPLDEGLYSEIKDIVLY